MSLKNKGLVKTSVGSAILKNIPIPKVRDGYLLVKTVAVAINPTDWQTVDEKFVPGVTQTLLGCDASGVVVEIGEGVTKSWKVGDRVSGFAHGGNDVEPEDGTFADYIVLKADIAIRIPDSMSFEEAATLGVGLASVVPTLYSPQFLDFPMIRLPLSEKKKGGEEKYLFIYGGSTATGTLCIQFAKFSGYSVITTASPHNFDLLKAHGADHVFDYRDPSVGSQIRTLTSNGLHKTLDCIATPASAQICADALTSLPSPSQSLLYVNLMDTPTPRSDVKSVFPLGYTVAGERFVIDGDSVWEARPEDFELCKKFVDVAEVLLEDGTLKPHPVLFREGGLDGVLEGMQELKEGKVSGGKLVYRIGEPPIVD